MKEQKLAEAFSLCTWSTGFVRLNLRYFCLPYFPLTLNSSITTINTRIAASTLAECEIPENLVSIIESFIHEIFLKKLEISPLKLEKYTIL